MNRYNRARFQGLTFVAIAIMGLYAGGLAAQNADDKANAERQARTIRSYKSRIRQVEEYLKDCEKEVTYGPLVTVCEKWKPSLLDMKVHWEKRLALLEEKYTATTQDQYQEEQKLYNKMNDGQRMYNYARTAFSHSRDKMRKDYRNMVESSPSLTAPFEKLTEARAAAEKFYIEMSEKGTSLTMEEIGIEATVLLGIEKAKCLMEFEVAKVHIDHGLKNLEHMPENVEVARDALIGTYTDILDLKLQRSENWARERVAEKKKHELERTLQDAVNKARHEEHRRRAIQEQEARRKAMKEKEARHKAIKEEARRKAEMQPKEAPPASDY